MNGQTTCYFAESELAAVMVKAAFDRQKEEQKKLWRALVGMQTMERVTSYQAMTLLLNENVDEAFAALQVLYREGVLEAKAYCKYRFTQTGAEKIADMRRELFEKQEVEIYA